MAFRRTNLDNEVVSPHKAVQRVLAVSKSVAKEACLHPSSLGNSFGFLPVVNRYTNNTLSNGCASSRCSPRDYVRNRASSFESRLSTKLAKYWSRSRAAGVVEDVYQCILPASMTPPTSGWKKAECSHLQRDVISARNVDFEGQACTVWGKR